MSDNTILQSLIKAFEILKDSWSSKSEAITKCIAETEVYDSDIAMDMWLYILQQNREKLKEKDVAEKCVCNVVEKIEEKNKNKYDFWGREYEYVIVLDHIAPYIVKRPEMIKLIFGESVNAGNYYSNHSVPSLIAGIFLQNKPQIASCVIEEMAKNRMMVDVTIGDLLRRAYELIEEVYKNTDLNKLYSITPEVKEALLSSIELIKNESEKADCLITILSI